jgi:hypothetical protein
LSRFDGEIGRDVIFSTRFLALVAYRTICSENPRELSTRWTRFIPHLDKHFNQAEINS